MSSDESNTEVSQTTTITLKKCKCCKEALPLDAFTPDIRLKDEKCADCKHCRAWQLRRRRVAKKYQPYIILHQALPAHKQCTQCHRDFSLEHFSPDKRRRDGKGSTCKECWALQERKRRVIHADRKSLQAQVRRLANPVKVQEYYRVNVGRINANRKVRRTIAPEIHRASLARRRARLHNAPVNDLTAAQWIAIKILYHWRCVYCGKKMVALTQDHITPLTKGGNHTMENIVPSCKSCNSKKHIGPPIVPVQPLLPLKDLSIGDRHDRFTKI